MKPPGADTVVVRYGDIGTKSRRIRRRMERQLVANIGALLTDRRIDGTVEQHPTRPLIRTAESSVEAAADAAADAFGVVSTSPALAVEPDFETITTALAATARECYDGGTFAIDARRAGDTLPFTSRDIQVDGGDVIWDVAETEREFTPEVDLDDPDVVFYVECRTEEAFIFLEKKPGPGGLPLGTQARVVGLVSGGIDSPVAIYEMMKRGCPVVPVYIELGEYGGPDHEARAFETVRTLAKYAPNRDMRVYRAPAGEMIATLADRMERGRMLAFRRLMYRIAEHIAGRENAHGIVTGEAIGQKSSQTLQNLDVTSQATRLPIHRPLLTMDKNEITERAKEIGTFTDSTIPAGCNRFAPSRVETNGTLEHLEPHEPNDLFERAERIAERAERIVP